MANSPKPMIGINIDVLAPAKPQRPFMRLAMGYMDAVLQAGGLPVLMPPYGKDSDINEFLDRVDGFILTGGLDMDPRRYNQPFHASVRAMTEKREENDRILVKAILERQTPVLGIGLGMQQLNVLSGGSLYVHLPEDLPRALPHQDSACSGPHRHSVKIVPNSRLDEIYGDAELLVVSNHHQAVREVSPKFKVAATSPDGVIEAIESEDGNWFALGLQWHPESEAASALEMQLFECFLQACLRQSPTLALAA